MRIPVVGEAEKLSQRERVAYARIEQGVPTEYLVHASKARIRWTGFEAVLNRLEFRLELLHITFDRGWIIPFK